MTPSATPHGNSGAGQHDGRPAPGKQTLTEGLEAEPAPPRADGPYAAQRAKLAQPRYAYLQGFAEPVIKRLELGSVPAEQRPREEQRLDAMFAVSHSPDGHGMPEVKAASNAYHAALGAEAEQAMQRVRDRAAFMAEVARVAALFTPRLEDGVQMTSVPRGEGAELQIAPNDWRDWIVPIVTGAVVVGVVVGIGYVARSLWRSGDDEGGQQQGHDNPQPNDQPKPQDDHQQHHQDDQPVVKQDQPVVKHDQPVHRDEPRQPEPQPPSSPTSYTALDRNATGARRTEGDVLLAAHKCFAPALEAALPAASSKLEGSDTYNIKHDDQQFTIRLMECRLGERVIRPVVNPTKDAHVLQLSERAVDTDLGRAVAHGIAEIAELRRVARGHAFPVDQDLLRRGPSIDKQVTLSARDLGALAEIRVLCVQHRTEPEKEHARIFRELVVLLDDLGLRAQDDATEQRWSLIAKQVGHEEADRKLIQAACNPEAEREHLAQERQRAEEQRGKREVHDAPLHELPEPKEPTKQRIGKGEAKAMADDARMRRDAKSKETLAKYRKLATQLEHEGKYPEVHDPQLGGGAALAGLRRDQMLIDNRGRWQIDPSRAIAQTAIQLRAILGAGLGDPLLFVENPNDRPPLDAFSFFEDSIAAQAEVIDGTATLELDPKHGMVLTVKPAEDGQELKLHVGGTPMIATGFPRERVPGQRGTSTYGALTTLIQALNKSGVPGAEDVCKKLATVDCSNHAAIGAVLDGATEVTSFLSTIKDQPVVDALAVLGFHREWAELRSGREERVLQGDHANLNTLNPHAVDRWVIGGVGGTSISAAEIILDNNTKAKVTMVGGTPPAGLNTNDQFCEVYKKYGPGGENRFDVITDVRLGVPSVDKSDGSISTGQRLAGAAKIDDKSTRDTIDPMVAESWIALAVGIPQIVAVEHVLNTNAKAKVRLVADQIPDEVRLSEEFTRVHAEHGPLSPKPRLEIASGKGYGTLESFTGGFRSQGTVSGDGYVNTLGRGGQASPIIEDLLRKAVLAGQKVAGELLWSDDGEYLGYRIAIDGHSFDVTGAASRFLPDGVFGSVERDLVMASPNQTPMAAAHDAPPEGGNFDGGFAASATQSARYARHQRKKREEELAKKFRSMHPDGLVVDLSQASRESWTAHLTKTLAGVLEVEPSRIRVKQLPEEKEVARFAATLGGSDLGEIRTS